MSLPQNKPHWYLVKALSPLFQQQVDDKWRFYLQKENSAKYVPCRRLDSAHIVLKDTNLTDTTLAATAKAFQDYMAQA